MWSRVVTCLYVTPKNVTPAIGVTQSARQNIFFLVFVVTVKVVVALIVVIVVIVVSCRRCCYYYILPLSVLSHK